ncbi:MAG: cation transporter, partial [Lachnospiraceae bacterium]|nr:cation transporter [Lachnospiraceae bacterium]
MNENANAPDRLEDLAKNREKVIVRTSVLGIVANVFLAAMKAVIGLFAHSIAVILDAVNNLTDVLSSVITVIGTKLAGKKPDKKHPFGHGRIEYFTEMIIGILILYAGITALVESVKKIITPEPADHSAVTIVILAAAIVVKLLLGLYVRKKGKEVNSGSLKASGTDALFDAILTVSVLVSAGLYLLFKINIEAYVGILISAFI